MTDIDQTVQRSREFFSLSGLYCAESVLLAIAESQGIQSDLIPRIATGFCGGMADTCGTCGAVTGAMMGIGLLAGRDTPDGSVEPSYTAVQKFLRDFEAKFGSTNCLKLCGYDLSTAEGQEQFLASDAVQRCVTFVEEATRLALKAVEASQ